MLDSILGKMAEAEVAFSEVVIIVDNFSGFKALVFAISKADLVLAGFFGEELLAFSSILGFLEEALLGKAFLFSRLDGIVGVELTIGASFISFEEEDVIEMPASFLEEELVDLAGKMGSFTPEALLAEEEDKVSLLSCFSYLWCSCVAILLAVFVWCELPFTTSAPSSSILHQA